MVRFASFVRAGSLAASLLLSASAAWANVLFYDGFAVRTQAEALGAVGAFKTDADEWKAFVFAEKMPFDPKGTYLMVR